MRMMMKSFRRIRPLGAVALVVFVIAGCNTVTQPQSSELNPGSLIADFGDGTAYNSTSATAVLSGSQIQVTAQSQGQVMVLTFPNAVGSYGQPPDPITVGYNNSLGDQYLAKDNVGRCFITITQLSPTVKGTFSARTVDPNIIDSVQSFTGGSFNATIQ